MRKCGALALGIAILAAPALAFAAAGPTWVQIMVGGQPVSASNPFPLGCPSSGSTYSCVTPFGAAVPGAGSAIGGRAQSSEAAKTTNGFQTAPALDLTGKTITSPFANRENYVRGSTSTAGTTATQLIAAQGSNEIYVTGVQCFRTDAGTTMVYVTLDDSVSTTIPVPAGGGAIPNYSVPLVVAAGSALTFTPNAAVSGGSIFCSAQGYTGY
jgi:hypothetical protein